MQRFKLSFSLLYLFSNIFHPFMYEEKTQSHLNFKRWIYKCTGTIE